ncbi:MAG: NTP transferase domain-containing protein [Chloroflexi bacterium]|nr:NTP transferase domain-containing protein [Chloroflexota bacterium]
MTINLPPAYVLVGGLGLRLRAVVGDRPKPLAEIGGRPFLEYLIDNLVRQGVSRMVLCTGYGGEQVARTVGSGERWGISLRIVSEAQPLGTGGAIRDAAATTGPSDEEILVLNGDSFFDVPLVDLVAARRAASADAAIALRRVDDTGRFGTVVVEGARVIAFREKTGKGAGFVNGGVYALRADTLGELPAIGPASLERDLFPTLIRDANRTVIARTYEGFFVDIGIPEDYLRIRDEPPAAMVVAPSVPREC